MRTHLPFRYYFYVVLLGYSGVYVTYELLHGVPAMICGLFASRALLHIVYYCYGLCTHDKTAAAETTATAVVVDHHSFH